MTSQYIIIAGSRSISKYSYLLKALDNAIKEGYISKDKPMIIISGGAVGVDLLAKQYAYENKLPYQEFKPDYQGYYDKIAPLRRNELMAQNGTVLIAIWDGKSPGTKHMISCMEKLSKPVYKYIV